MTGTKDMTGAALFCCRTYMFINVVRDHGQLIGQFSVCKLQQLKHIVIMLRKSTLLFVVN